MVGKQTSREVDGQTIQGTTRLAFLRNGSAYYPTQLAIRPRGTQN